MHHRKTHSFPEETQESRQLSSLDGALHLELCIQSSVHPVHRYHLLIVIQLHHPPTTHTPSTCLDSQQRAIGGNMVPKTFNRSAPTFVFFTFPPSYRHTALLSLTFTHWVRCKFSLPLPIFPVWRRAAQDDVIPLFLSFVDVLALCFHCPKSSGIWCLPFLHDGRWFSLCFCRAFFFATSPTLQVRATNFVQSFLRPSCFHDQFPRLTAVPVRSRFVCLSAQHSSDCLQPHSFLQFLTHSCVAAQLFRWTMLAQASSLRPADHRHVHRHLPFKKHMTALASLLTCLHLCNSKTCFLHAFCCSFHHLFIQTPSAQASVAMVDKSPRPPYWSPSRTAETDSFLPAAAAMPPQLQPFCKRSAYDLPSHALTSTKPILSNFLTPNLE